MKGLGLELSVAILATETNLRFRLGPSLRQCFINYISKKLVSDSGVSKNTS